MDKYIQELEKEFPIGSLISPVSCRRLWLYRVLSRPNDKPWFDENTAGIVLGFVKSHAYYYRLHLYYRREHYTTAAFYYRTLEDLFRHV